MSTQKLKTEDVEKYVTKDLIPFVTKLAMVRGNLPHAIIKLEASDAHPRGWTPSRLGGVCLDQEGFGFFSTNEIGKATEEVSLVKEQGYVGVISMIAIKKALGVPSKPKEAIPLYIGYHIDTEEGPVTRHLIILLQLVKPEFTPKDLKKFHDKYMQEYLGSQEQTDKEAWEEDSAFDKLAAQRTFTNKVWPGLRPEYLTVAHMSSTWSTFANPIEGSEFGTNPFLK